MAVNASNQKCEQVHAETRPKVGGYDDEVNSEEGKENNTLKKNLVAKLARKEEQTLLLSEGICKKTRGGTVQ